MDELQSKMWDLLSGMSGEDVLNAFTNYYGLQKLDEGFAEFLCNEGYCDNLIDDDSEEEEDCEEEE